MTHAEAAEYLSITPQTLHFMNYNGTGPNSFKVGRYRRYRLAEIDAWLESQCR